MSKELKRKLIRSNRRTLTMQILSDSTLVIKAPNLLPLSEIEKFISKNQSWIDKRLTALEQIKPVSEQYQDGGNILYLGKNLQIKVGNFKEIKVEGDFLLFPNFILFRIQKELDSWLINQAKKLIITQLDYYAKEMKTSYKSVMFSVTRSKWGSCTYDNRLQFNWRLIMAPLMTINYVIIHELAHTIEKNHGRAFWSKVRLHNPSYKQQIKWLKEHGSELMLD